MCMLWGINQRDTYKANCHPHDVLVQSWRTCWGKMTTTSYKLNIFVGGPGPSKASFSPFTISLYIMNDCNADKHIDTSSATFQIIIMMIFHTKQNIKIFSLTTTSIFNQPTTQQNTACETWTTATSLIFQPTSEFWMACCKNILASWKPNPGFWFGWIPWWLPVTGCPWKDRVQ